MMEKRLLLVVGLVSMLAVTIMLLAQDIGIAQDCRIIRVHGGITLGQSEYRVEPETVIASKGTCVIWFNRAVANEIKIVFKEGKRCASMSEAPVGFSLDHEQCFVTTWVPFGGTASLKFTQAGTFDYTVEVTGGETETKGRQVTKGTILIQ
jgi:hypothetical protein